MVGVFGLAGEVKLAATRIGEDALVVGLAVRATLADGSRRELRIRALRRHKGRPLLAFEGVDDATAAERLVGSTLAIDRDNVHLEPGEYFDDDLVGCTLVDESGRALGDVVAVEHFPAQDVVRVGPRRAIVPLVGEFVRNVDVRGRRIIVALPPGLLDETEAEVDRGH